MWQKNYWLCYFMPTDIWICKYRFTKWVIFRITFKYHRTLSVMSTKLRRSWNRFFSLGFIVVTLIFIWKLMVYTLFAFMSVWSINFPIFNIFIFYIKKGYFRNIIFFDYFNSRFFRFSCLKFYWNFTFWIMVSLTIHICFSKLCAINIFINLLIK